MSLTFNRENENWRLLLSHCRYFDKSFTEMFLKKSSTKRIIFVQTSEFDKAKFEKRIFKNHLLRSYKGDKAETLCKCL